MAASRGVCSVALLLAWLVCVNPPASADASRDGRLTLQARQSLFADPDLAACNLGVVVRDGVATLVGLVPSAALVSRAVERVQRVQGLREVRSELTVSRTAEPDTPRPRPPVGALTSSPSNPTDTLPRPPRGEEIILAVERLRRLDDRFRRLRAELHGRVVILRGDVTHGEDAMDLAQAIAKVPGVERVMLQYVRTGR